MSLNTTQRIRRSTENRLKVRITKTVEFFEPVSIEELDPDVIDDLGDPAVDIPNKVTELARLLGVDEATAQRVYLEHSDR